MKLSRTIPYWGRKKASARVSYDANHWDHVNAALAVGGSVIDLASVGDGCPDLLVGYGGKNFLVEVKTEDGEVQHNQVELHKRWMGLPVIVSRNPIAMLRLIGALKE